MTCTKSSLWFALLGALIIHCSSGAIDTQHSELYFQLESPPTDLQVSPFDASIVVSAGYKLHLLNPDFSPNASVTTHDRQEVYKIGLSYNTSDIVLACKDTGCTHYDVDWLYEELFTSRNTGSGFDNVPLSLDPAGFYVANSDTQAIKVLQIDQDGLNMREFEGIFQNPSFYQRQFLYGFVHGEYVYYISRDNGTNASNNVRVMRLCHDFEMFTFDAAYEAVLECSAMSATSRVEVSHSLMDAFGNPVITFSVTTDHETNICSFAIADIDAEMDASYTLCASGDHNALKIPLVWYDQRTCTTFSSSVRNLCDFNLGNHILPVPALASFHPVSGHHLLQFNSSEEVTALLTAQVGIRQTTDLLFVALSTNQGDHYLDKYHITSDGALELVYREEYSLSITLLRWNELMQEMYGGNANSVFGIPLERCSNYTTCGECTSSGDPLCGWCTLEQSCSQRMDCSGSSHTGHWVNASELCIESVSLSTHSMAVDFIQSVELVVSPGEASLPSFPPVHYQCTFYHETLQNTSYSFTAPYTAGKCQIQLAQINTFDGPHIDLNFSLQLGSSDDDGTSLFPTMSVLVLHNCSLHTDCVSCVEASESCGWCVHDRVCTGRPSKCRHQDDWRSLTTSNEHGICPVVITPDHGSYTLPVAVRKEIILSTINIPPEIPGYEYGCQIVYSDGALLQLEAEYYNHTELRCFTHENQVLMSNHVTNGSETTKLEILWLKNSNNLSVTLYSIQLTLYDCARLGGDCSSCLSANLGSGFQCLWCDRLDVPDTCTVFDFCKTHATLFSDITNCPLPTITGINPASGPTVGGTELTVTGTNLGAVAGDVSVELVKMVNQVTVESVRCAVDRERYTAGSRVVCTTSEASEGPHLVSVTILRGTETARPLTLPHTFTYAHPIINSVRPKQGPKAGGTNVVFLGSNLDISNPEFARAFIGNVPCDIEMVTETVIYCVSRPVPTASVSLRTRITIDSANLHSQLFNYTENPVFTRVEPQNIIPAGGVTLTFRGNHLDVVVNPELILTIDGNYTRGTCTPKSSTILKCLAPKLPTLLFSATDNTLQLSPIESLTLYEAINYTVSMDGADGPSYDREDLVIVVKPDPLFFSLHNSDREYTLESGRSIRIMGSNVDSVLPSELSVVVDDTACNLVNDDISDTQIRCFPPDTVLPGDRLVRVFVGKSGLNYSVGFMRYIKPSSSSTNSDLLLIIIPALTGVILLMLTILAVLCCSIGVLIRRKRAYKAKQRATGLQEEEKSQIVPVFPNMYNGSRQVAGEHDYATIPDVLEQMQLQQIEMITCAAQHGVAMTDISTTKRSGNIYYSEDEGRGSSATSSNNRSGSSRPASVSLSGGSRPHSSSTTGSVSLKRLPLPPLPTSMSDEYVAMHSYTGDDSSPQLKPQPHTSGTATVVVHVPPPPAKPVMVDDYDYDKLEPKKQDKGGEKGGEKEGEREGEKEGEREREGEGEKEGEKEGEREPKKEGEKEKTKMAGETRAVVLPDQHTLQGDTTA